MNIGVIGIGLAEVAQRVLGVASGHAQLDRLNRGKIALGEPGCARRLRDNLANGRNLHDPERMARRGFAYFAIGRGMSLATNDAVFPQAGQR